MRLGEIVDIRSGYLFRSGIALNLEIGTPILQMGDFDAEGRVIKQLLRVQLKKEREEYFLRKGDLLLKGRGGNLRAVLVDEGLDGTLFAAPLLRLRIERTGVVGEYLMWCLNQLSVQKRLKRRSQGTAVQMLTINELNAIEVDIPCEDKQQKIAAVAELAKREQQILEQIQKKRALMTSFHLQELLKKES